MHKLFCHLIMALLVSYTAIAQQGNKPMPYTVPDNMLQNDASGMCGLDISLNRLRQDPEYKVKEDKMNREILNFQRNLNNDTTVVPVVFSHYKPGSFNGARPGDNKCIERPE